jgi:uncharacterized alpha/beta hydrolase family protein
MKRNYFTIIIAAILILIFGSLLFIYQVRTHQWAGRSSEVAVADSKGLPPGPAHPELRGVV